MKRLIGVLGWLGVALVGAAVILRFTKPESPEIYQNLAIAGLVVTVIYALTQWRDVQRSFQGRNVKYGSIAAGSVLVFLAILVAVNWIASRQNKRWDLTESQQFSLSDQTRQIVRALDGPLKVHVFYGGNDDSRRYRDRFGEYQYLSKQVDVTYVAIDDQPTLADKYGVTAVPTVVMEYQGRSQRATSIDEQALTNTLKKLLEGKAKKIYFLEGHGERDIDDQSTNGGYKAVANALVDENFEVAKLPLAQQSAIPADATVVVVAGAKTDLFAKETELLTAYLKNGGKLMLLIDPPEKGGAVQPASLIALAKSWGVDVGENIIVDPQGQAVGLGAEVPVGLPTSHPITAGFRQMTAFPLARSVSAVEGGADGKVAQPFVQTGQGSWAESDVKGLYDSGQPERDAAKGDKLGPVGVGAAVSAPAAAAPPADPAAPPAGDAPKPESRLVVIGDSDFGANRWATVQQLGNLNLFLNASNWLAQQEDFIAIRPKDPSDRRVDLTAEGTRNVFFFTFIIMPLALFGMAVWVYWRRR